MWSKLKNLDEDGGSLFLLWVVGCVSFVVVVGFYLSGYFFFEFFEENSGWGDFIGGSLNPILTFATFVGVLLTLGYQRRELALSTKQLSRSASALEVQLRLSEQQKFESSFFEMLAFHNQAATSLVLSRNGSEVGRKFFKRFIELILESWPVRKARFPGKTEYDYIVDVYISLREENKDSMGAYFRFLYNFFRVIDDFNFRTGIDPEDSVHAKLLRSQLSDYELAVLLLNCQCSEGKNFCYYVDRYNLMDNYPSGSITPPEAEERCLANIKAGSNQVAPKIEMRRKDTNQKFDQLRLDNTSS